MVALHHTPLITSIAIYIGLSNGIMELKYNLKLVHISQGCNMS